MKTSARYLIGLALAAICFAGSFALTRAGAYGLTIFVLLPVLIGAMAGWVFQPSTAGRAAGAGALTVIVSCFGFLFLGIEGLLCVFMAIPLAAPLGALGGLLAFRCASSGRPLQGAAMLLLLTPGSLAFDFTAQPPVFEARSSIVIAAPPERVWSRVIAFSELPEPGEWYFRAGLAYPQRARIEGSGPGAIRYCEFSTGPFVEPIVVWDQPRLLRFRVAENPAPMHEWSPYALVLPKHLHGYLISKQGQFRLTPLPGGRTLLEGTTWYQHGLWPAEYWRWWSDAIIHRIHMRVLTHIRTLSEQGA